MEPYHGRRGKLEGSGVCGMNRAHQTMLLMVAMVATMAVVLVWESSPLVVSGVAQSPVLKEPGSALEELANSYESGSFFRNYSPAKRTTGGSADLTESDVTPTAEETEPNAPVVAVEDELEEDKPESSADTVSEEIKSEVSIEESISTTSNETLAERSEETSLAEEETSSIEEDLPLAGKERASAKNATRESTLTAEEKSGISLETEESTTTRPDAMLSDADPDARTTLKPRGTPLSGHEGSKAAMNSTTATDDEAEGDEAITQKTGSKAAMNSTIAMEDEADTLKSITQEIGSKATTAMEDEAEAEAVGEVDAKAIVQEKGSKAMNATSAMEDDGEREADAEAIKQEMGSKAMNSTTAMEDEAEGVAEAIALEMNSKAVNATSAMEDEDEGEGEAGVQAITQEPGPKAVNSTIAMEAEGEAAVDAEAIAQETTDSENKEEQMCDYSVGKWVLDETRPLYSGFECKMWLSPGFSCRLNNHPDKLLDRYRWQPSGCELPDFNASSVLEMLRNKVVAFVGDSLGRQQLQSLLCMLTRGKNDTAITDIGASFGFFTARGERKPNGFAFRFDATNTTIVYKWSVTLARIQPLNRTDRGSRNALHLDRPEEFIETHLPVIDVLVLNTGHHWNYGKMKQNKFDFYLHGKPVQNGEPVAKVPIAYNVTVHNVLQWMHNATIATPEKIVYYRSLSPRHFRNGDWNTGGTCDTITLGKDKQVQEGMRVDPNAESAVIGTTVNLLNITSLSLERGETHVSKYGGGTGGQDCLHWCLPGIPDTWNEIFFAELATKLKRRGVGSNRSK